jgi:hypothetical protein
MSTPDYALWGFRQIAISILLTMATVFMGSLVLVSGVRSSGRLLPDFSQDYALPRLLLQWSIFVVAVWL